jgi:hypothetical protein
MGPFALHRANGKWSQLTLPAISCDSLNAVFGFDEADVYFVGDQGTILHYDGKMLTEIEVPTTRWLRRVGPLGRKVCVGGTDGILLYGSMRGWRQVPTGTDEIIDGIASWKGRVFFGTPDGVWQFDGKNAPSLALGRPAQRVQSFADGLLIEWGFDAHLWDGATVTPLDTIL